MAIEYILLGLLQHEPRHGYDLAREFTNGTALGEIIHLEPGMLYAYLKKLEQAGLVEPSVQQPGTRPPRRVYSLTTSGAEQLEAWLCAPVSRTRDARLEFLLKLYLAHTRDGAAAGQLIAAQREVVERLVASLSEQTAAEADMFHRAVLQLRLMQNQALLNWLDETRALLVMA